MPPRRFDTPRQGGQAKAAELQRLARSVEQISNVIPANGLGVGLHTLQSPGGVGVQNNQYVPFWAKVTGQAGAAITQLNGTHSNSTTTLTVDSATNFPAANTGNYWIKIEDEILEVTAGHGATNWTVVRAKLGTSAVSHADNTPVEWIFRPYSWMEAQQDSPAGFIDKTTPRSGTGTAASRSNPAYEVNDVDGIPTGAYVQLFLGYSGDYYLFDHCCTALPAKILEAGTRGRTLLSGTLSDSATTLTVDDASSFPDEGPFRVCVGGEHMLVIDGQGTATWTVRRGVDGTDPAAHADDDPVIQLSIPYAWEEVEPAPAGGWEAKTGGLSGTTSSNPAYERNGNGNVEVGTVVWLTAGSANPYDVQERVFDYCCEPVVARITAVLASGYTLLNGAVNDSVTSLAVDSGASFPSAVKFRVKIDNEVMVVTAGMGGTSWTVTRGAHGTTAAAHGDNSIVEQYGAICDWVEVEKATVGDWNVKSGGLSGESDFCPAYERNGNNAVPVGLIVELHRGYLNDDCSQEWVFDCQGEPEPWCATFGIGLSLKAEFYDDAIVAESWCATFGIDLGLEGCFADDAGSGTGTVTSVAMSVPGFLSVSGSPVTTSGTLAVSYSGTALPVANGGTNSTAALNSNRIMVSSSGAIVEAAALTNGQLLIGSTGAASVAANITAGSGISVTNGAGSITIAALAQSAAFSHTGSSTDAYGSSLTSLSITAGHGLLLWGTIKVVNSNDLMVKVTLTDAWSNTEDIEFTVLNFSQASFNLFEPFPGATTVFPPFSAFDIYVKSAFAGSSSDYEIKLARKP